MQKVTFIKSSISNTEEGKATDKSKFYAIVRVEETITVKHDVLGEIESIDAYNAIIQSTKATVDKLDKLEDNGKGTELPFHIKPLVAKDDVTGDTYFDCIEGTDIRKASANLAS
jgi:hypothetical protein